MVPLGRGGFLPPPVAYQGGKVDLAKKIVDLLPVEAGQTFCELCCGSGAVSLELVARGKDPNEIVMVDAGPWAGFYESVGRGDFSIDRLRETFGALPTDPGELVAVLREIAARPVDADALPYTFLVLQAASFGGKAIWTEGDRWKTAGVRNPHPRQGTFSPLPSTVIWRAERVAMAMRGVRAERGRVEDFTPPAGSVVYIDPPYAGTTGYGYTLAVAEYLAGLDMPAYISEGRALSDRAFLLDRRPGSVLASGSRSGREEWLSVFGGADAPILQLFPEGVGV